MLEFISATRNALCLERILTAFRVVTACADGYHANNEGFSLHHVERMILLYLVEVSARPLLLGWVDRCR